MCLQRQPLIQERLLLQPLGEDEPPAAAPAPASSTTPTESGSWLSRLSALFCCLPSPVALLKAAYVRWYDARARRRFLRRQRHWRQDCADMAAADLERGQLVTSEAGGDRALQDRVGSDGDMVSG